MPIEVCYRENGKVGACVFHLQDDAHYWFLHPWFVRINKSIGKYIDLYGETSMNSGSGLSMLIQALREAKLEAERQPERWEVHVGTQLRPVKKELYKAVWRDEVLRTLAALQGVAVQADQLGKTIVFSGD